MIIPDHMRVFLAQPHYATIATIDADGGPRQATVWYRFDGDDVIVNSLAGRTWPNNLMRDGRVSIAVRAGGDGYQWVGLTGVAEPIMDQPTAQADIAEMAVRYHAHEPEVVPEKVARFESQERIGFRVRVQAVHDHLDR
jgi:PPOX class probable F420-dependent enzyme